MTPLDNLRTKDDVVDLVAQAIARGVDEVLADDAAWRWHNATDDPEWVANRHEARLALDALRAAGWRIVKTSAVWDMEGERTDAVFITEEWKP